jgi:hypothetical protein
LAARDTSFTLTNMERIGHASTKILRINLQIASHYLYPDHINCKAKWYLPYILVVMHSCTIALTAPVRTTPPGTGKTAVNETSASTPALQLLAWLAELRL